MALRPMVPPTRQSNDDHDEPGKISAGDAILEGGSMILGLVQQASKLAAVPYLSSAAGLALSLVQVAQAVKENKEGFKGLADEAADIVAVFYRSYQGAENQEEWLNSEGIKTATRDLDRTLDDILKLGEKMKNRGLIRRTLSYTIDAGTIKKYRQKLASALSLFDVATKLDGRDMLIQIKKNTEELLKARQQSSETGPDTSAGRVVEAELRARRRIQIENVEASGISFGAGSVVVENGGASGGSGSGRSTPHRQRDRRPSPTPSPSPESKGGASSRPDISVSGIYSSGIAFGDGDVSVSNW